jgi:hypothetical protein
LAWVRELVSMIHLAKFSGAPAAIWATSSSARAAVEGLSELTWQEEPATPPAGTRVAGKENEPIDQWDVSP